MAASPTAEQTDRHDRYKRMATITWAWIGMLVLVGLILYALYVIQPVLLPFVYAVAVVYLLRPVVDRLQHAGLPRVAAVAVAYLLVLVVFALAGLYIIPIISREISQFLEGLPKQIAVVRGFLAEAAQRYQSARFGEFTNFIDTILESLRRAGLRLAEAVPAFTINLFGGLLNVALGPIIAFYILKDLHAIKQTIIDAIPPAYREEGLHLIREIDQILSGFLKGQLLVALSVAVLSGMALYILGIDYALLIGMIIGVFDLIPYLGPVIGAIPAVLVALTKSWTLAIVVVVVLFAVQQVESILISPNIMKAQVNLHPVVVIFSLLLGATLLGVMGMLLAIPVAAVGKAFYLHFRERERTAALERAEGVQEGA